MAWRLALALVVIAIGYFRVDSILPLVVARSHATH
jgi:hypothetical protein